MPSKDGNSSKIKVKMRLDIHGILQVVSANLVEKGPAVIEPEPEAMDVENQDGKSKPEGANASNEVLYT